MSELKAKIAEIKARKDAEKIISFHGAKAELTKDDGNPWKSAAEFEGKPEPKQEWIVKDFVPRGEVTLLAGDGGLQKSTAMIYLCAAVVEAQKTYPKTWMGQPVAPGRALFFTGEDPESVIQKRLCRYCVEECCNLSDLADLEWRSVIEQDTELAIENPRTRQIEPTALYHQLRSRIEETRPALVVIENASDVFGGSENDRLQVRRFLRLLKILALRYNCAIVLLAHPSKNREFAYSGSTAWHGAVRAFLTMKKPGGDGEDQGDPDARILTGEKMQFGQPGRFIKLRNHGGHLAYDDQGVSMKPDEKAAFAETVFIKLLDEYNARGRYQTEARVCANFANDAGNEGVTKRAFKVAMDALFRKGMIELHEEGPPSRRVSYIHRKEGAEA
jgi:RecA-family ATPase